MEQLFREYFWIIPAVFGMTIPIAAILSTARTRQRELDVLKSYAERGAEPPAAVLRALSPDRPPATRSEAWTRFTLYAVMAAGFGGLTLWLATIPPALILTFASGVTAIVMIAFAAMNFVRARTLPRT